MSIIQILCKSILSQSVTRSLDILFLGLFRKNIIKCDKKLLQSVAVITKWDKILLQSVAGITRCDKKLLQSVTGIRKCENHNKMRLNNSRGDTDASQIME